MKRSGTVKITIYLDRYRDAEVIDWLQQQRNMSAAIVAILKREVEGGGELDLGLLRSMIESIFDEKLARLQTCTEPPGPGLEREDRELEVLLDSMTF